MPTGYTSKLESRNFDVKTWLKEDLVRAMGICASLRDHADLTQDQILTGLRNDSSSSYYVDRLKAELDTLAELKARSDQDWSQIYATQRKLEQERYDVRVKENEEKLQAYRKAMEITTAASQKIKQHAPKDKGITRGVLELAAQQLQVGIEEYSQPPYCPNILNLDLENYRKWKILEAERLIEYLKEQSEKEKRQTDDNNRSELYSAFCNQIDSIFIGDTE